MAVSKAGIDIGLSGLLAKIISLLHSIISTAMLNIALLTMRY